jgi:hypothetical protein
MRLFGRRRRESPDLDRKQSMQAVPVMNQFVTIEYDSQGRATLNLPRKRTGTVRMVARFFRLPPYKQIELDELGTYAVELCDGKNCVEEIVRRFAEKYHLNRREAEVSMVGYLQTLAKRGIIGFAVSPPEQRG